MLRGTHAAYSPTATDAKYKLKFFAPGTHATSIILFLRYNSSFFFSYTGQVGVAGRAGGGV
jgi:hypothetical protein